MRETVAIAGVSIVTMGRGPTLLCLHPASGPRVTAATELLANHFTLFLPTMPGFDDTLLLDGVAGLPGLAQLVGTVIEQLPGGQAHVAGHSFGGWIAAWLAVLQPDSVARLVLQCPAGFVAPVADAVPPDAQTLQRRTYTHPEKRRVEDRTPEAIAQNRARFAHYHGGRLADHDLVDRLGEITAETLILHGREDGIIPRESPTLLASRIPHATLSYVDDAAHNLEVDQPESYATLVQEFLLAK